MTNSPLLLPPGKGVLITLDFSGHVPVQVAFTCTSADSQVELASYFFPGNRTRLAASFSYRNNAQEPHSLQAFVTDQQGQVLPATVQYALVDHRVIDYGPEPHAPIVHLSMLPLAQPKT